jgi:beta-phosphoglucomutase
MPAVIFDFDGVIVDSEPAHEAALRAVVRELGMDFSAREYAERFLGFGDRDILERVFADHSQVMSEGDFERASARKWEHFERAIGAGAIPVYGASVELLTRAAGRGPVAVCSGARRREIEAILARIGVRDLVMHIVSADDTARSKPDPAPYELVVRRLGVRASECVAIEDTDKGVASAKGAGVRVVGVCHSMGAERLRGADLVVGSTEELSVERLLALA